MGTQSVEYDAKALESALAKLRAGLWILTPDESAALLARLEALEQRVEAIGRAVEIARKRGALALEIDVAMEAALSQEPRNE